MYMNRRRGAKLNPVNTCKRALPWLGRAVVCFGIADGWGSFLNDWTRWNIIGARALSWFSVNTAHWQRSWSSKTLFSVTLTLLFMFLSVRTSCLSSTVLFASILSQARRTCSVTPDNSQVRTSDWFLAMTMGSVKTKIKICHNISLILLCVILLKKSIKVHLIGYKPLRVWSVKDE